LSISQTLILQVVEVVMHVEIRKGGKHGKEQESTMLERKRA
jgi:hypothetical protein